MVITLELPVWHRSFDDPLSAYEKHFGALPAWFEEVSRPVALSLARQALRAGVPLTPADHLS
ncbi:MAG: hypothetical protein ABTS16_22160 [Candidatus Accumulibacter phosphatis]|jgi:hypothetical protein|uniref:Uncharacterized protein n=1 Tax=Candidatus Accumulibacter contiguus TaxID=2954381 RepID=A0ABX1T7X9_9PROT|nr:hypothetical protein [Candidatus Accumulibacter contiguus]NMQ04518.1 hypothetical protein [Candidatus Accumulibacter contiguus]